MTLAPRQIGDKGQRFMVECDGWPKPGTNTVGYSTTEDGARRMAQSAKLAPSAGAVRVIDREACIVVWKQE